MNALVHYRRAIDHADAPPGLVAGVAGERRAKSMSVTVENLAKEFGTTAALNGVSLDIAGGELIALLGPSGSGKTTLLRLIAGLEFPTSGRIRFGDDDASAKSVQERNVGFVFQHYALFRHLTVFENIAFGLRARPRSARPDEKTIRARVVSPSFISSRIGLERRYPSQLSADSASAWRWRARLPSIRACCCSTSPSGARRQGAQGTAPLGRGKSMTRPGTPPSSSRMTRRKHWSSPTVWW